MTDLCVADYCDNTNVGRIVVVDGDDSELSMQLCGMHRRQLFSALAVEPLFENSAIVTIDSELARRIVSMTTTKAVEDFAASLQKRLILEQDTSAKLEKISAMRGAGKADAEVLLERIVRDWIAENNE